MRFKSLVTTAFAVLIAMLPRDPAYAQKLTLEEALDVAGRSAPLTVIARQMVDAAEARLKMAESALYPHVGLSSSYVSSDNPVQAFMFALDQGKFTPESDVNNPPRADNWQVSIQAELNIFSGGAQMANRRAARLARDGQLSLEAATFNDIVIQVIKAYLAVLTAQEFKRASEAAVKSYEAAEAVMTARVDAGAVLKTDILNIQVQRIQAEERRLRADNEAELAKERLKFTLGSESLPYSEFASIDEITINEPHVESSSSRPELMARNSFASAAHSQYSAARGSYLPNVSLFASADRYQGWEFDGTGSDWTIGLRAQWSIFDGFLTSSTVRGKKAAWKIAEEEARIAKLQMNLELSSTRSSLLEATQRVAVMTKAAALASESAILTRQRFDQGLVITSQVIDAENALVQAEVGLAQAKADRLMAVATLRRALDLPIVGE